MPLTPEPAAPLYQTEISQTPLAEVLVKTGDQIDAKDLLILFA